MNYVGEKPADPITFAIYPDASGRASTTLYEDDGVSPAYKTQVMRRTTLTVSKSAQGFRVNVSVPVGNYNPGGRRFRFVIKRSPETAAVTVADNGKAQQVFLR
jgi:alpha-glucosidase (family GH31 glycosyl hydrolase)